jgi:hypothetical protein
MLLTLGVLSLVFAMSFPPIGVILGLCAWIMGGGDRKLIQTHRMDPDGAGNTYAGWVCGIIGTLLGLVTTFTCGAFITWVTYLGSRPTPTPRPTYAPTQQPWQPNAPQWQPIPPANPPPQAPAPKTPAGPKNLQPKRR